MRMARVDQSLLKITLTAMVMVMVHKSMDMILQLSTNTPMNTVIAAPLSMVLMKTMTSTTPFNRVTFRVSAVKVAVEVAASQIRL